MRAPRLLQRLMAVLAVVMVSTTAGSGARVRVFLSEEEFVAAARGEHMEVTRFLVDADTLQAAVEVVDGERVGPSADFRRELTFTEEATGLGFSFGLTKLSQLERNAFAFQGSGQGQGGLSLGGRKDDDFAIFFRSRSLARAQASRSVYGIGWQMVGNENMRKEMLSVFNMLGEKVWYGHVDEDGSHKGAFSFVGVLSDEAISEIQFDEDDDAAEHVIVRELIFATRDAHILDGVSPTTRMAFWAVFNLFIIAMLCVDFFCADKGADKGATGRSQFRSAAMWTLVWICLALWFDALIWVWHGRGPAVVWLTSYLLEKFLSVDNLFVFLTIFNSFKTPIQHQYKVLLWGIVGAIVLRTVFIVAGVMLLEKFAWIMVFFGVFLIYTGIKLLKEDDDKSMDTHETLRKNVVIRIFKKFVPITAQYDPDGAFFVSADKLSEDDVELASGGGMSIARAGAFKNAKWAATPLFIVLLVIETTDVMFAVDSIPAVLSITSDSFIAYTSNIFAILGLRALYFCLAAAMHMFHYLPFALSFILIFIGAKMLLAVAFGVHVSVELALLIVVASLSAAVIASLQRRKTELLPI